MSPPDNPFGDLGAPGEGVKKRARQMRQAAKRQRWALLGGGAASFTACVVCLAAFGGLVGLAGGLAAAGGGAFGGAFLLFVVSLRMGLFGGGPPRETSARIVTILVAGALLGAMLGLLVHIGGKYGEEALLIVTIVFAAGSTGGGLGYALGNRPDPPPTS